MKEVYNNTIKEVGLLMEGKIKSLRFCKVKFTENGWLDDERLADATRYLDGKGVFYTLKLIEDDKYGQGIELELIDDPETIDYIYEDLDCILAFDDLTKEEDLFLEKIDKQTVPTFYYYMTREQLDHIRFDLVKYVVSGLVDMEVFYTDGVVAIKKHL